MIDDMKKYIDAELQIVHLNNNDVIATSTLSINEEATSTWGNAADRFRDFEDYSN